MNGDGDWGHDYSLTPILELLFRDDLLFFSLVAVGHCGLFAVHILFRSLFHLALYIVEVVITAPNFHS